MKALPVRLVQGIGYVPCEVDEATHVTLNIPGGSGILTLPIILRGTREGTGCWTWNGSTEAPTLRPSVRTRRDGTGFLCHSWISDGNAQFLDDTSHELRGQTVPLLEVSASVDEAPSRTTDSTERSIRSEKINFRHAGQDLPASGSPAATEGSDR